MRKHFKSSKCSRDAKYFPSFPAPQQQELTVPVGSQAGAVRYRTKAKREQSLKGEHRND